MQRILHDDMDIDVHRLGQTAYAASVRDLFKTACLLELASFRFAKTMPDNPHFYTVRDTWEDDDLFTYCATVIQREGTVTPYRNPKYRSTTHYRQLPLDGYSYWTMGWPPEQTTVINRKRKPYETPYDEFALVYDEAYSEPVNRRQDAEVRDCLGDLTGLSVLDIGCGTGLLLDLAPVAPELYRGIDPSEGMLREFAAKHPAHRQGVLCCSFQDYFPRERSDVLVALYGVGGLLSEADLRKAMCLLKPGGSWYIMTRDADAVPDAVGNFGFTEPYHDTNAVLRELADSETRIEYHRLYAGRKCGT